jgi:hypothetical protein
LRKKLPVAGFHRASPSTTLDKSNFQFLLLYHLKHTAAIHLSAPAAPAAAAAAKHDYNYNQKPNPAAAPTVISTKAHKNAPSHKMRLSSLHYLMTRGGVSLPTAIN